MVKVKNIFGIIKEIILFLPLLLLSPIFIALLLNIGGRDELTQIKDNSKNEVLSPNHMFVNSPRTVFKSPEISGTVIRILDPKNTDISVLLTEGSAAVLVASQMDLGIQRIWNSSNS